MQYVPFDLHLIGKYDIYCDDKKIDPLDIHIFTPKSDCIHPIVVRDGRYYDYYDIHGLNEDEGHPLKMHPKMTERWQLIGGQFNLFNEYETEHEAKIGWQRLNNKTGKHVQKITVDENGDTVSIQLVKF